MNIKQLAILTMLAIGIAACGGGQFEAAPGNEQDAASEQDANQPVDSGKDSDAEDTGNDAKPEGSAPDADAGSEADAPLPEAAPEASPDAVPDAVEEPTVPETGPDTGEADVVETDAVEPDADPCPNGGILDTGPEDCGQVPTSGLWICVIVPHIKTCGTVGIAGSNPPLGLLVDTYWNDPMIVTGGPCIAPSNSEDSILCKLQAPSLTTVQFAPGLHNGSGPTIPSRFACDSQGCRGRVRVYKDGTEVGGMQNSTASGIVSLVQHQGRKDLAFTAP